MTGRRRLSIRTRLSLVTGALFLATGAALLVFNYVLVSNRLPAPFEFAKQLGALAGPAVAAEPTTAPDAVQQAIAVPVSSAVSQYRASVLATMLNQSLIALAVATVLAVLLGRLVAGRAMRPVHAITATARELSEHNLDRRIGLTGPRDEIRALADTFDEMLGRLATAFEAQRRFVANASHELRTPLALQRTLIEVALDDPELPDSNRVLALHLLRANERTEALISGLLLLARSERGLLTRETVRLDRIVAEVLSEQPETGPRVETEIEPASVNGDPVMLARLAGNLVDNARRHNVPGGWMRVSVGSDGTLTVANGGPPISPGRIGELFEPFRRLAPERTDSAGSGLGLSIVRAIAEAHGGTCEAHPGADGGLTVVVRLG